MKNKRKKKIHKDKNGREFIKNTYFVGGKMKHDRIYLIDGIPENEFYEKNATDLDFFINGDYELINSGKDSDNKCNEQNIKKSIYLIMRIWMICHFNINSITNRIYLIEYKI